MTIIHGCGRPPFRIRVLLSTENEEQKKRGRPGNEARHNICSRHSGSGMRDVLVKASTAAIVIVQAYLQVQCSQVVTECWKLNFTSAVNIQSAHFTCLCDKFLLKVEDEMQLLRLQFIRRETSA